MTAPITIPCCHCDRRIDAREYAAHIAHCFRRGEPPSTERQVGDVPQPSLSRWEKRMVREGRKFTEGAKP